MPRYLIQRNIGPVSDEELHAAALNSRQVREEQFPDIVWEHSHIIRNNEGLTTYCVYGAPNETRVLEHAKAAGLPADLIHEIHTDIHPERL